MSLRQWKRKELIQPASSGDLRDFKLIGIFIKLDYNYISKFYLSKWICVESRGY